MPVLFEVLAAGVVLAIAIYAILRDPTLRTYRQRRQIAGRVSPNRPETPREDPTVVASDGSVVPRAKT